MKKLLILIFVICFMMDSVFGQSENVLCCQGSNCDQNCVNILCTACIQMTGYAVCPAGAGGPRQEFCCTNDTQCTSLWRNFYGTTETTECLKGLCYPPSGECQVPFCTSGYCNDLGSGPNGYCTAGTPPDCPCTICEDLGACEADCKNKGYDEGGCSLQDLSLIGYTRNADGDSGCSLQDYGDTVDCHCFCLGGTAPEFESYVGIIAIIAIVTVIFWLKKK